MQHDPNTPLTVAQAREAIRRTIVPITDTEDIPIDSALGRVLDADLASPLDLPSHDNAAMDGYAVRIADLDAHGSTTLTVAGKALAGRPFEGQVQAGQAIRIMTGAMMPEECDTVVVQEAVQLHGSRIHIPAGQRGGQNRRLRGEDLTAGAIALKAGHRLAPADLGLAASLGLTHLRVRRRVVVAVFSTGDELLTPGQTSRPGAIYDSNRYALRAMLQRLGADTVDLGVLRDDPVALEEALSNAAARADVVLTSGGVSAGDADFVRDVLHRHADLEFWKIAIKPGRPLAFGKVKSPPGATRTTYMFGLPGNPVATIVAFYVFVRDALLALAGASDCTPLVLSARCLAPIRKLPGREEYQRAVASVKEGGLQVMPTNGQGSAMMHSMCQANCLIVLPAQQGDVGLDQSVNVVMLDGLL